MLSKLFINQAFNIIFLINYLVSLGLRVMYASDKFVYAKVIIQRYGKFKHPIYLGHLDALYPCTVPRQHGSELTTDQE